MQVCRFQFLLLALAIALGITEIVRGADLQNSAYLSEFLAQNRSGLQDKEGDRSGWIEIYNGGDQIVNLAGWFLTDDTNNLVKWRFPRVSLLPNNYLVVFASGRNRTNNQGQLHANFRLRKAGGYLALVNRATNVVSEFAQYPPQSSDVSYGRVRGEPRLRGFFQRPTPGKPNVSSGPGFGREVKFSAASRTFTTPFDVELSAASSNVSIHFTLDGKLPTTKSPVYRAPLHITNTTQLRARTYETGKLPGPPGSESYLLLNSDILTFTSTLPVLVMDTFGRDLRASARSSFVQISLHEPIKGIASLTNLPTLVTRGGYHIRGSTSSGMPQPGFAMQFLDEFDQETHRPVLGLPPDSDWVLYAPNVYDPVMIHNPFIHQLSRDMGRYSPRTRFVEVYFARGAGAVSSLDYQGVYVLEEKIKVGKNRVNIDRLGATDLQPPEVTGGYLLKIDRLGPGEGGFNAGGVGMVYVEPKEPVITLPQRAAQDKYLTDFFNTFDRALNSPEWKDHELGYRAYIDVNSWIDFHVLEVLSGNVDTLVLSTYLYKPRNGKITFGPHWDFDRALGSTDGRDDDPRHWNTGRFFDAPWWSTLFNDPDFWQQWVDRWQELRLTHFSTANLNRLIDQLADEVREAQPREYAKWGLQPRGGTYQSEIDLMKAWLSSRVEFIDWQLVQPPRLNREGGRITNAFDFIFTAQTNSAIYYTLDGSDPRLVQGAISSNAVLYAGPIRIDTNAQIIARARNPSRRQTGGPQKSTPWSRAVRAEFVLQPH